ncbi:c-type cytochrome domain-containing protein [Chitinophaga barathri]|nr:c-type cytochrome domain-containing protein [Chitinophaga barathri]
MMILLQGNWSLFIGRFHPLLVHLPIGMLIIAFILEVMSKNRRLTVLSAAVLPVLVFGALSAIAACIAGLLLSSSGGYDEAALDLHMWMGIGVAVISVLLCVFRRYALFRKAWLPISFVMIVLLSAAGHFGGNLTHGEDYLTAEFPLGKGAAAGATTAIANLNEAKVYDQLVRPILEQKCYSCHNEAKLKGGLRLDGMDHIRKGGENGPVIKDSVPEASELYKRLILSEADDKRMPPKGKPQLTPQQLEILYWWIEQGASPDATVKDLHHTPRMQLVLEGMQPSGGSDVHPFMPQEEVSEASPQDIGALEKIGVKVMPVANENGFVMVSAVNASGFGNKEAALLLPLKKQIVWLKLSNTQTGDSALKVISQLPELTRLYLENTPVTDEGLVHLANCKQLKYLNLVGTKVTDKGILLLQKNAALKELFLYKTAVTPAALSQLRKAVPEMAIDTGGYRMPALITDTLVYRKQKL